MYKNPIEPEGSRVHTHRRAQPEYGDVLCKDSCLNGQESKLKFLKESFPVLLDFTVSTKNTQKFSEIP